MLDQSGSMADPFSGAPGMRSGALRSAFPLDDPAAFGNHPALVPTRPRLERAWIGGIGAAAGDAARGDVIWQMSDAIAQWYLRTWPTGPWAQEPPPAVPYTASAELEQLRCASQSLLR